MAIFLLGFSGCVGFVGVWQCLEGNRRDSLVGSLGNRRKWQFSVSAELILSFGVSHSVCVCVSDYVMRVFGGRLSDLRETCFW